MIEQRTSLVAMSAQNWRQVSRGRDTPQRRIIIIDEVFQIEASIVYFLSSAGSSDLREAGKVDCAALGRDCRTPVVALGSGLDADPHNVAQIEDMFHVWTIYADPSSKQLQDIAA
jgi:Rad3-related DNA helicase